MSKLREKKLYLFVPVAVLMFVLIFQTVFSSYIPVSAKKESYLLETADYGEIRDTMSDTWIAVDDYGREVAISGDEDVKDINKDKHILMFYYNWCLPQHVNSIYNVTEIIDKYNKTGRWKWGGVHEFHYSMEPYYGYYRSDDPWVIRKDIQMLCDAGVDGVFFDAGNGYLYHESYRAFFEENLKRKEEGQSYLKVTWMLKAKGPKAHVSLVLKELYETYYTSGEYDDIFYTINGKPLMLCPKTAIMDEFADYFEVRECWAWDTGEGQWPWVENSPQVGGWNWGNTELEREMVSVAAAQHANSNMGKSFSNGYQPLQSELRTNDGLYFTEQWEYALDLDPQFVLVTQWNEWIAQRFVAERNAEAIFLGRAVKKGETYFVDTCNAEYSRDISPMKDGYRDNYYYLFVNYARKFRGAREIPVYDDQENINIKDFSVIKSNESAYYDDLYDTMHRDHPGSTKSQKYYYKDDSGRNDFEEIHVASDKNNLYFYARTVEDITAPEGTNWMNLLLNTDADYTTGWHGYDYIVNRSPNGEKTSIESYGADGTYEFTSVGDAGIYYSGKEMTISVPKNLVNVSGDVFTVDFKFADNIPEEDEIMLFIDKGDVAPNNRFNYRYSYNDTFMFKVSRILKPIDKLTGSTAISLALVIAVLVIVIAIVAVIIIAKKSKKQSKTIENSEDVSSENVDANEVNENIDETAKNVEEDINNTEN